MKTTNLRALLPVLVLAVVLVFGSATSNAATITVVNGDGPGEGFNDPTPVAPVGGNTGTTLGAQRLEAFKHAAKIIGDCIVSPIVILVDAKMDPLTCTPTSAVLGSAGPVTVHKDFTGVIPGVWYPQALANAIAGADLSATSDISATFNSSLTGAVGCLGGTSWYYGLDAAPPALTVDFVTVVLHEISHGLGFLTLVGLTTGAKFLGFDDTYELHMVHLGLTPFDYPAMTDATRAACNTGDPDLVFTGFTATADAAAIPLTAGVSGGFPRLHGPAIPAPGSSLSHWSPAVTPDENMEPFLTGPDHTPGLTLGLFADIGWTLIPKGPVAVAISTFQVEVVDGAVRLLAEFSSTDSEVDVNVYRAREGSPFAIVDAKGHAGSGTFTWIDRGVEPGQSYSYKIGVKDSDGEFFSQAQGVTIAALVSALLQNTPNPFNPATTINFVLAESKPTTLSVYDAQGRLVRTLVNGTIEAGPHALEWNGLDNNGVSVASGIYFYRLVSGRFVESRKMVLLK